jgi:hypothetical protein
MYHDFYVFGIVDGKGERIQTVCTNVDDVILIEGHFEDGRDAYFEAKARNLQDWALDKGLKPFKYGYKLEQLEPGNVYHDHGIVTAVEENLTRPCPKSPPGSHCGECDQCMANDEDQR